jgi:hypothetical protein
MILIITFVCYKKKVTSNKEGQEPEQNFNPEPHKNDAALRVRLTGVRRWTI